MWTLANQCIKVLYHYVMFFCFFFTLLMVYFALLQNHLKTHHPAAVGLMLDGFANVTAASFITHSYTLLKHDTVEILAFLSFLGYRFWTIKSIIAVF